MPRHGDSRRFLDAVFWILRTGVPPYQVRGRLWRDLPPDYGDWENTHRRFCRCRDRGVWPQLLELVIDDPDFEWLMIDASYIKVDPHGLEFVVAIKPWTALKGADQQIASGGGCSSARCGPVRLVLTEGTWVDCTQAQPLIARQRRTAQYLLADKGYGTNAIVAEAVAEGMEPVIPPRSHRKEPRYYDRDPYRLRHLVENAFLNFKQWRGIATRYAKRADSFLAIYQIRAFAIWPSYLDDTA